MAAMPWEKENKIMTCVGGVREQEKIKRRPTFEGFYFR